MSDCTTGFYTRKVKYTQETFTEKLSAILEGFPRLQDIHPFRKFVVCRSTSSAICLQDSG